VALAPARLRRQPVQRGAIQDIEVSARLPRLVQLDRGRPSALPDLRRLVQHRTSPYRAGPARSRRRALRHRRHHPREARRHARRRIRRPPRTVRAKAARATEPAQRFVDQQARRHRGGRSVNTARRCLIQVDRFRTLIGSATAPEQLVVELQKVDCFTYADYVEALKRAKNREEFIDSLMKVRYKDGVVGFENRKHFFTDWSVSTPAIATDVTTSLSANAIQVTKNLNQKDSGGVYLPGLPIVPRTISYIPSQRVDS